jgi:hypothetical protein
LEIEVSLELGVWFLVFTPFSPQFIRPTVPRPVNIDDFAHFIRPNVRPKPYHDPSHPSQRRSKWLFLTSRDCMRITRKEVCLLLADEVFLRRMNPATKLLILAGMLIILLLLVWKAYGRSGLESALLLAGVFLFDDLLSHFFGPIAAYAFTGVVAGVCVAIWYYRKKHDL